MYKYAHGILKELGIQEHPSRDRSSRYFSTQDQKQTNKALSNTNDKKCQSYVLTKIMKFHADKQILLAKKRKTLLWYKMILDRMVTPLVGLMPSVASSHHLSKLTDFRTNSASSHRSEEITNKNIIMTRPKCVEEPLPILIKPEYKTVKSRKKTWKILNKFTRIKDSKIDLLKIYKNWKNKYVKDHEDKKSKFCGEKQLLLAYDLFLKNVIDSKIQDMMPSITAKDEYSNIYDFRVQTDHKLDVRGSNLTSHKERVVSKNIVTHTNMNKGFNRNKSVVPKASQTKKSTGNVTLSVKSKPLNLFPLNIKENKVETLNIKPIVQLKEEIKGKSNPQRFLHKQNWSKGDNIVKPVRLEVSKEKPVMKKVEIVSKTKKLEFLQGSGKTLPLENKVTNKTVILRDNIEKRISNCNLEPIIEKESAEELYGKCDESLLHEDEKFQFNHNILNELQSSSFNMIETTVKNLEPLVKENQIGETCTDHKTESILVTSAVKSDTLSGFKPNVIDEQNIITGHHKSASDDVECLEIETFENQNNSLKNPTEIVVRHVAESESKSNSKTINSFTESLKNIEEETKTLDNTLKNTYLVALVVNDDDEGVLQTRSQVIGDRIKGDFVDLNIVIQEEKKAREGRKDEKLPQTPKCTNDVNALLNTRKSEMQCHDKVMSDSSTDKNFINKGINTTSNFDTNISIQLSKNDAFPNRNINTSTLNSKYYGEENTSILEDNSLNHKLDKENCDIVKRHVDKNKDSNTDVALTKFTENMSQGNKNNCNRTCSLDLIGKDTQGKRIRHKRTIKGKNIFTNIPDKRSKVMNKIKEQDKSNKYQEIIESVKKIIPRGNSNENILGSHSKKNIADDKMKNHLGTSKTYSKTINDLKEIISELPGTEDKSSIINNCKNSHIKVLENISNKTTQKIKSREERDILSITSEIHDSKQIKMMLNDQPKKINLKNIKIVDRIPVVKEDLKQSIQRNNIGISPTKHTEKDNLKIQLEYPKTSTLTNTNRTDKKKSNSQTELKTHLAGGLSGLNFKIDMKNTPEYRKLAKYSSNINTITPLNKNLLHERTQKSQSVSATKINERKPEGGKEPIVSKNNKSIEIEKNLTVTTVHKKTINKSVEDHVSNMTSDDFPSVSKDKHNNNTKYNSHDPSNEERDENYFKSLEKGKSYTGIVKSKSNFNLNKTDASKKIESKRSITISETNQARGIGRRLSITGNTLHTNTAQSNFSTREKKSKNQISTTVKENDSQVSTGKNNIKTKASENSKLKFVMEKFVKNAKNSLVNPRKIIKFTRFTATAPTKSNKTETDFSVLAKKEIPLMSTIKGTQNKEDYKSKQTATFQKPLVKSTNNDSHDKDKITDSKTKKETVSTNSLANNMLKVKVISKETKRRNNKASNDMLSSRDIEGSRVVQ